MSTWSLGLKTRIRSKMLVVNFGTELLHAWNRQIEKQFWAPKGVTTDLSLLLRIIRNASCETKYFHNSFRVIKKEIKHERYKNGDEKRCECFLKISSQGLNDRQISDQPQSQRLLMMPIQFNSFYKIIRVLQMCSGYGCYLTAPLTQKEKKGTVNSKRPIAS